MIDIKELKISFNSKSLVDIAFTIKSSTALIGESGSGKSLTLKAILNLLSSSLDVKKSIKSDFELSFNTIGFIPQNPFTSLSSMTKIKNQIFCSDERKEEVFKLLDLPLEILEKYEDNKDLQFQERIKFLKRVNSELSMNIFFEKEEARNLIQELSNLGK